MAMVASLGLGDDGPVVRHRADAAHADVLRRTGERLAAAAHPGVVAVRSSGPVDDGGWELVTAHAGHPVAPSRVTGPGWLAAVGAGAAATLADLHDRGVVHGHLEARHVLVGPGGRVVLCGFGADDGGSAATDDVAALGALLADLATAAEGAGSVAPSERDALRALGAEAGAAPATRRPSARRLAAALADLAADGAAVDRSRRRARVRLVVVGALAGALVVGLAGLGGAGASGGGTAPSSTTSPTTPSTTLPAGGPCVARPGIPLRAAECGHDVSVRDGAVVVDGRRSVVGRRGDEVVAADWGCAGTVRAAVLRPATGEVLVLTAAGDGGAPAVTAATRVPGAVALRADAGRAGCPRLLVERADGDPVPVDEAGPSLPGPSGGGR